MNPIEEEKRLGSEKTLINSENDQNKLDEVERTKVDSHQDQRSKSEKPIDESVSKSPSSSEVESSSSSSSESESESEIKKESQKPTNSLIDKFKEIYQNWKRTIISNWKKNTSMRPLDVGERQRNSETKPGTYLHWYRTSESLLAKLFRGIRRYFTIHKPKPVSGPLEPKVGEKVTSTETKMTESTQEIKSAPEIQKVEKSKDV
ncbi:hypothetical protein DFH28DRAFT_1080860 [Melampsora americana]|nr:hypothetical protein DFH28DRAFT_1080860 [Melampsora americana]